ncbi:MAG: PD-(D/E)XK nuclease family protein [Promethearchaeota archaeon]
MAGKKKWISIGVTTAVKIDCPVRVPLLVHARLRGIKVRDRVTNWRYLRAGRVIHQAFEHVMASIDVSEDISPEIIKNRLVGTIIEGDPAITIPLATRHATVLLELQASVVRPGEPGTRHHVELTPREPPVHERFVSTHLTPLVRIAGRIDTLIQTKTGYLVVERKTGVKHEWHHLQARIYGELLLLDLGDTAGNIDVEVWYSSAGGAREPVRFPGGTPILNQLRKKARLGASMNHDTLIAVLGKYCRWCENKECGLRFKVGALVKQQ